MNGTCIMRVKRQRGVKRSRRRENERTRMAIRKVRRWDKTGLVANKRNEGRELHRRFFICGREE